MTKRSSDWELRVAENSGEVSVASVPDGVIKVPVAPLNIDVKAQLLIAAPKTLTYTVGWRALVWQNKETNQFQDLSDEEYAEWLTSGDIKDIPDNESVEQIESSTGNEGQD